MSLFVPLCNLCVLCVSVVNCFTTETQSHRDYTEKLKLHENTSSINARPVSFHARQPTNNSNRHLAGNFV